MQNLNQHKFSFNFRGAGVGIKTYLHFLSFLYHDMSQVVERLILEMSVLYL